VARAQINRPVALAVNRKLWIPLVYHSDDGVEIVIDDDGVTVILTDDFDREWVQ
jgi:hypothetical protein